MCLVDIAENGKDVAAELNEHNEGSKAGFVLCDVTDYNKFKGRF